MRECARLQLAEDLKADMGTIAGFAFLGLFGLSKRPLRKYVLLDFLLLGAS